MITHATGTRCGDGLLKFHRRFQAPLEEVWASITDPNRTAEWIGSWSGNPAGGMVDLHVDTEAASGLQKLLIEKCIEPTELALRMGTEADAWQVEITLRHGNSVTTLELAQRVEDAETAAQAGPGWDFYLDRLMTATTGGDLAGLSFSDYRRLARHYRRMFRRQKPIRQSSTMPRT